jgi:hypothetical protein
MIHKIASRLPAILNLRSDRSSRDRDPQQGNSGQGQEQRQPSQEEAQQAFANLLELESIKASGLILEFINEEGRPAILVKNSAGKALRVIRGNELFQLSKTEKSSARILDRRV